MVYKVNEDREMKKIKKDIVTLIIIYTALIIVAVFGLRYMNNVMNERVNEFEASNYTLVPNK